MKLSFDESEITEEKSLWDVYLKSRRITPNKYQVLFISFVILLLFINSFFLVDDYKVILADVRKWAELGFNFSITTLGFLIAGFTIFATLSKPEMMLAMMDHTNQETGLRTLKYNFFTFMKVFISYIFFSLFYLLIVLLGQKNGFIPNIVQLLSNNECTKLTLINTAYIIVGGSFVYLLLLLKSFVFNIYAIVMNFLRWEYIQRKS